MPQNASLPGSHASTLTKPEGHTKQTGRQMALVYTASSSPAKTTKRISKKIKVCKWLGIELRATALRWHVGGPRVGKQYRHSPSPGPTKKEKKANEERNSGKEPKEMTH